MDEICVGFIVSGSQMAAMKTAWVFSDFVFSVKMFCTDIFNSILEVGSESQTKLSSVLVIWAVDAVVSITVLKVFLFLGQEFGATDSKYVAQFS